MELVPEKRSGSLNRQLYGGITTARDVRSVMDLQRASLVKEVRAPGRHQTGNSNGILRKTPAP